jgi:ribosomal protein S18 acetylase RimI-like enzyme
MAMLVAVRGLTGGYLNEAEKLKWDFLKNPDTGTDDLLIGTKFGDEVMAALVLRLEPSPDSNGSSSSKKRGSRANNSGKGGKGLIRAWTVRLRFQRKGVGTALLEEAVKITREKLGRDAEIGFVADHANSTMILPEFFNGPFRKKEAMAIRMLEEVISGMDDKKRR